MITKLEAILKNCVKANLMDPWQSVAILRCCEHVAEDVSDKFAEESGTRVCEELADLVSEEGK